MILIAEPVHFGDTHVQVNAALVSMICTAMPKHKIKLVAENGHIAALKTKSGDSLENIELQNFKKYNFGRNFFWVQKIFGEWKTIFKVLKTAKREKPELLVWLSLFPTGHLMLHLTRLFFPRSQKHLIVLHGEMEYLSGNSSKWQDRFLSGALKMAFKLSDAFTTYLFLSDAAKRNFETSKIETKSQLFSILHPFIYSDTLVKKPLFPPIKVVLFGALQQAKNVNAFYELAEHFADKVKEQKLSFITLGKMNPELQVQANAWVQMYKPDEFIPQEELEEQLSQCHLALFFYNSSMYRWSASGAILEAINQNVPVITFENEYFREILTLNKVGVAVENIKEMHGQINLMLANPADYLSAYNPEISSFIQQNSFLLQTQKIKSILNMALV
ncbi:MAG: glycosyltransferase [Chitinophagaceae bacterium]